VVDEVMRTSDPDILALGEIAEFDGQLHGITAAAEEQARVAAAALAGDVQAVYQGSMAQNLVKVDGLTVASLGVARPPADDLSYEEIVFLDRASRVYRKCVIRNDRLVGALLVGDNSDFVQLRDLIRGGEELGARRAALLRGNSGTSSPRVGGKVVCSCTSVDEGAIGQACERGATTLRTLMDATGAGTGCGSCRPEIASILKARTAVADQLVTKVAS
jgi:ferredoxin-nitrate reductase